MFRKCKGLIIVLLILSLSFVPSVNSASNIFDDPVHVNYNTLKTRLTDYVNTPDYMKPYEPLVVGRNEYVDSTDILSDVDDLSNILPFVNNDTVNSVENTPLFKNMNTILVAKLKDIREVYELPIDDVPTYLDPFLPRPGLTDQVRLYNDYQGVARNIQNIISDTLLLEESGNVNIFRTKGENIIKIDGVDFTFNELFSRIRSANTMPDGTYMLNDLSPLSSGQEPPKTITVEKMVKIIDLDFVIGKPGAAAFGIRNAALISAHQPTVSPLKVKLEFKTTDDGKYPAILMDKENYKTQTIVNNEILNTAVDQTSLSVTETAVVDLTPVNVKANSEMLGFHVTSEGTVEDERLTPGKESVIGFAETGLMFVFAIVCFITAWVYR
jgi:hypothetical protein